MNVIVLNDFAWINGGASKVALLSARGLAARNVPVRVFAGSGDPDQETQAAGVEIESLGQQPFNRLGVRAAWKQSFWNAEAADALAALLDGHSPQETVLHIHSCRDVLSGSVVQVAQRLGFKMVCTHHDYGGACPYGGFFNYKTGRPCGRFALSPACIGTACNLTGYGRKLFTVQKARRERRLGFPGSIAAHVFVSDFSRQILERYLPATSHKRVIRNPIPLNKPEPAALVGPFTFVGRLTLEKDPVTFARAAAIAQVEAMFVGDGPLAEDIRVAYPQAQVQGWLAPSDVQARLRETSALVFPSAWYEGQPLAVDEALANGIPVVSSDACAARDVVEKSGGGLIFPAHDERALADHLMVLGDHGRRRELGQRAYEWFWADPPTMDRHVDALLGLYERVLAA